MVNVGNYTSPMDPMAIMILWYGISDGNKSTLCIQDTQSMKMYSQQYSPACCGTVFPGSLKVQTPTTETSKSLFEILDQLC